MRVCLAGTDQLSKDVQMRLEKEGVVVVRLDANAESVCELFRGQSFDFFLALDDSDETNLVLCALVKQLGPVKTVASLKKSPYLSQKEVDLQRAFHIDLLIFPDLLVVDNIAQILFEEGIYSRSFLHGNVLLRTMLVTEESSFSGKTLSEIRDKYQEMLVCLIHRPHKILATTDGSHLIGVNDELLFAHGKDLLLPDDEITMLGQTESVLKACQSLAGEGSALKTACIVGSGPVGQTLAQRLKKHDVQVLLVPETIVISDLPPMDAFVACHRDEEHNFVLAVQAKDRGLSKVIAVLSDKATCLEADKLGITHVPAAPVAMSDRLLEFILGAKVTSVMSLYETQAEIYQMSVSVDSSIVGVPLSVLGPTLPKEILVGVIYSRGRIFIAAGSHILKPQDECLIIADPKHRPLLEKII